MWLKRAHGGILPYGKHRDKFYNEVYDEFPEYAVWACSLADPSVCMRDFQNYIRNREREDQAEDDAPPVNPPTAKRARKTQKGNVDPPPASWECKVCFDAPITCVFLPCKHMVCCGTCAERIEACPICRRAFEILSVFRG